MTDIERPFTIEDGNALAAAQAATLPPLPPTPVPVAGPKPPAAFGLCRQATNWLGVRRSRPREWGFHPSEMKGHCPVLHHIVEGERANLASENPATVQAADAFLRTVLDARAAEFGPGLQMELREGDYIHDDVRFYLGALGYLVGRWRCSFCEAVTPLEVPGDDLRQMPRIEVLDTSGRTIYDAAPCACCHGRNLRNDIAWYYVEPYVKLADWEIDGHVDGILAMPYEGQTLYIVLEIKSINEAGYEGKYGGPLPKEEHVEQASLYAWAWGIGYVMFIYVNKNQVRHWKEIIVPRNEAAIMDAQQKILAVQHARREGKPPLHARACRDIREPRAAKCPAVERCFGMKPPENFMAK